MTIRFEYPYTSKKTSECVSEQKEEKPASAPERKEKREAEALKTNRCLSAASFDLFSESAAFFSSGGAALIFFASVFWIKPKNEVGSQGQRPFNHKQQKNAQRIEQFWSYLLI